MHNTEIQRLMHENATMHGLLLWALYHSQGGSSPVGQPIRRALGIGTHDHLTAEQVTEAKQYGAGFPYEVPYHTEDHTLSAHDELLKIHAILQAPGDCPESTDDDTLTVRMLKDVIHALHSERRMKPPQNAAQTEAIALAYGYLWHVNEEPFAPIPTYTPQRAAYDARKILRDTMTHEQRGEAINKVRAMLETPNEPNSGG